MYVGLALRRLRLERPLSCIVVEDERAFASATIKHAFQGYLSESWQHEGLLLLAG